jgi:DNA-binding NarL/FixJ family response regulator
MNIVIIAQNKIFRESLKTVLAQIAGFNIVFDADNFYSLENPGNSQIQLVVIDFSISKEKCINIITDALSLWQSVRFLFMINYKEEIPPNFNTTVDVINKNASKSEFENIIRNIIN